MFADDSVKNHNNTQAIDVGNNTLIAAHVNDYKGAATPPLASIKDAVKAEYIAEQAAKLARKDGAAKLAELQKSKSTAGFGAEQKISRTDAQGISPLALSAIFKADDTKLPGYVGVDLGNDGYAIYRINSVVPPAPIDPNRLTAAQRQLAQVDAQTQLEAYMASLRKRSKVKLYGSLGGSQADSQ